MHAYQKPWCKSASSLNDNGIKDLTLSFTSSFLTNSHRYNHMKTINIVKRKIPCKNLIEIIAGNEALAC